MQELHYARGEELSYTPHIHIHNGKKCYPSDLAIDSNEKYYRVLELSKDPQGFSVNLTQRFSTFRVQKILDTKHGDIQWTVLNK